MADITTLDKSLRSISSDGTPFVDKEILYINDTNNSSYNGNIQFDTTVLANSGRWLDYSSATLQVPLCVSAVSTVDITAAMNAYAIGLKSGHHQLIDSIQVEYANRNVVQVQSFTNFHVSYKILSEWSADDLEKWGDLCGVAVDSPASVAKGLAVSARGDGTTNNVPFRIAASQLYTAAAPIEPVNEGFGRRLKNTARYATGNGGITITSAQSDAVGRAQYLPDAGVAAARIYTWKLIATIRLKDVCDFFKQMPLVRGAQLRMNIVYNSTRTVITNVAAGPTMGQTAYTQLSGRSSWVMASDSTALSPGNGWVAAGNGSLTVECNVLQTQSPAGSAASLLSSCRLYVPAYTMAPPAEAEYLSLGSKYVPYKDIYQFTVPVDAGANFNTILTNGIVNPKRLVIVPVYSGAAGQNATVALQAYQSIFDTVPATTSPACKIQQFNVFISGRAVFQSNQQYDFDAYQNELALSGVGGGMETGISSGLISRLGFDMNQSYYVVDLARRLSAEDVVPKSVQIQGINGSSFNVQLFCFVEYERSLTLDLSTGALLQ